MQALQYRPEIDGLRALAVVAVILFHAGFTLFSGGFVGVDVFFVISGYLITSIIVTERQAGSFSLLGFYERRARRILPALFLVMSACLTFAWLQSPPTQLRRLSDSLIAVSAFASNFLFWTTTNYFEIGADLNPLLHTWSLAVEEQYYLLFPLVLMLAWPWGRSLVVASLAVVGLASLGAAQLTSINYPAFDFFMLPTRGWELLLGALTAIYLLNAERRDTGLVTNPTIAQMTSLCGVILIFFAVFAFGRTTPFPSLYALVPTTGAVLVIMFATRHTLVGQLLGSRIFVGIGLISYSAYLWHQPLFAFARSGSSQEPSKLLILSLIVVAISLAFLTWRYVEAPFRSRRVFNRNQIFFMGALASSCFILIGLAGHFNYGYKRWLSKDEKDVLAFIRYDYKDVLRDRTCLLQPEQTPTDFAAECGGKTAGSKVPDILVWGDSYAASFSYGARKVYKNLVQYTSSACPPIVGIAIANRRNCQEVNSFILSEVGRLQPRDIFLMANWHNYAPEDPVDKVALTISAIHERSPQSRISVVGSLPQWFPVLPIALIDSRRRLTGEVHIQMPNYDDLVGVDNLLRRNAEALQAKFLSALDVFCRPDGACLAMVKSSEGTFLTSWDNGHLTAFGSKFLSDAIFAASAASSATVTLLRH